MDDQMVNLEVVGENLRWYLHIYINNKIIDMGSLSGLDYC